MDNIKIILITLISLGLFLGGIVLLISHVSFWSYFFGIPLIQVGIIFLISTFEKLSQNVTKREIEKIEEEY